MYNFNASSAFFVADHYGIFYAVSMSWINIYANDGSGCNQLVIGRESTSKIRMLSKSSEITLHFICIGEINMSGGYINLQFSPSTGFYCIWFYIQIQYYPRLNNNRLVSTLNKYHSLEFAFYSKK